MAAVIRRLITGELHASIYNKSERRSPTAGSRWIKTKLCRQPRQVENGAGDWQLVDDRWKMEAGNW